MTQRRVELPDEWTEEQRDGLRYLLEQTQIDVEWDGDFAFECSSADAEQVDGLVAYFGGKGEVFEPWDPPPAPGDTEGDPRELLVAGRGLRLAGWFFDLIAFALASVMLLLIIGSPWPRFVVLQVLDAVNAIVLVVWLGGNVGNLIVGTQVVMADDATRPGWGPATLRWAVIYVPYLVAGFAGGWWWFGAVWSIVVYGPILFTPLRQGLHDRAAGVLVIKSRYLPERWALANQFFRRVRG